MEIIWDPAVPPEVQATIMPHLTKWQLILPTWVHLLKLQWEPTDSENEMRAKSQKDYRTLVIGICPAWLSISFEQRDATMCHEFVHPSLEPLHNVVNDLLDSIKPQHPEVYEFMDEARRYALEESVCDLQHMAQENPSVTGPRGSDARRAA